MVHWLMPWLCFGMFFVQQITSSGAISISPSVTSITYIIPCKEVSVRTKKPFVHPRPSSRFLTWMLPCTRPGGSAPPRPPLLL